ncbi:MAG TPA: ABC transporter ATP-binding protein, partial [Oscillospiraceae bacterium]|nr:ABC transporter ATP-binding protein [Oscillospiraceae bacterium]
IRKQSVLTLSGGELQRTFLAQIFAQNPRLLILDEPTNHLDLVYQQQVFDLIRDWIHEGPRAVMSVVHDLSLARTYGTDALLMDQGRAAAYGSIDEVLSPDNLRSVYSMDVYGWMRKMLSQWDDQANVLPIRRKQA